MKSNISAYLLLIFLIINALGFSERVIAAPAPEAAASLEGNIFYDRLGTDGRWISHDRLGWVWTPYNVPTDWRPYTVGHWLYSDYGWTWVSDEKWGWATYHYGRWYFDANFGWVWAPGTMWGPAWVSWRYGEGYIGWAPLPPEAVWDAGTGPSVNWEDIDEFIPPHWYSFVEERYLTDNYLQERIMQPLRNDTLVDMTKNITAYEIKDNRILNSSLDVTRIERETGMTINRYQITDARSTEDLRVNRVSGNQIKFYRPTITRAELERAPR